MTNWTRRLSIFLGGFLLLPITSEFVISRVKGEAYDLKLALSLIVVVGPMALLLYYVRPVRMTARLIMSMGLMGAGGATAVLGFLLTTEGRLFENGRVQDVVGVITIIVGLIVLSIGALYFGRERHDVPMELPAPNASADPTEVKIERFPQFRSATHNPVIEKMMGRMSVQDLHYVAYYVEGKCIMSLDLLDHPELARFHEVVEPYQRREEYGHQGKALDALLKKLNHELAPLNTGELIRLVLDVERGAIYYYLVTNDTNRFLIGVTLNQYKVHVTDSKMALLVDDIRVHLGQPKMTELEQAEQ
ncbi:MAG TPA: hypothetical protein DGT23_26055 [Micromonosporaceae bacterium]|nr:hypothetical protein [Micromonosporaceae bacterium]